MAIFGGAIGLGYMAFGGYDTPDAPAILSFGEPFICGEGLPEGGLLNTGGYTLFGALGENIADWFTAAACGLIIGGYIPIICGFMPIPIASCICIICICICI